MPLDWLARCSRRSLGSPARGSARATGGRAIAAPPDPSISSMSTAMAACHAPRQRQRRGRRATQRQQPRGHLRRLCRRRGRPSPGADPHGGLGGIKPPYLPNTHGYPPKPPLDFWDETMKRKRGGRRKEEEEEEKSGHDPPLHFRIRFATVHTW